MILEGNTRMSALKRIIDMPITHITCSCVMPKLKFIGEAKTADRFDAKRKREFQLIQHYRQLASMIGARRLVFSTRADQWDPTIVQSIQTALAKDPVEFLFLTKNQLFS